MFEDIMKVTGLSGPTIKELMVTNGWRFVSEYQKPLRFELDLLSEMDIPTGGITAGMLPQTIQKRISQRMLK